MSPWEYQEIRRVLGHGSGFDSPGFRRDPPGDAARSARPSHKLRRAAGPRRSSSSTSAAASSRSSTSSPKLLIEWDERITMWRVRHYKVVARVIGDEVVGTQGTPVELLGELIKQNLYPELWQRAQPS